VKKIRAEHEDRVGSIDVRHGRPQLGAAELDELPAVGLARGPRFHMG
jgi:hypothetical protein